MKKTLLSVLLTVLLILSLCACGGSDDAPADADVSNSAPADADGSSSAPADADGSSSAPADAGGSGSVPADIVRSDIELGDTIGYVSTIKIDGKVYAFPTDTTAVFEADGWVVEDEFAGLVLKPKHDERVEYSKDGATLRFEIKNISNDDMPLNECFIKDLELYNYFLEDVEIVLAGGLTFGTPMDDILSLYGEPDYHGIDEDDGNYEVFSYSFSSEEDMYSDFDEDSVEIWVDEERLVDSILLSIDTIW